MSMEKHNNAGHPKAPDNKSHELVDRFCKKARELAREGSLGAMRTRISSLRSAWESMVTMLDKPSMPILIYGEKGTGKRRLVDEFLILENFTRKIGGRTAAKLKVYRADYAVPGFCGNFIKDQENTWIFFEDVERLSVDLQNELLRHFELRSELEGRGIPSPRLIFSTQRALSLLVMQGKFKRELFEKLTQCASFLPSLNERADDMHHLVASLIQEIGGTPQLPSHEIMNRFSTYMWPANLDELRRVLESLWAKNADPSQWKVEDLPTSMRPIGANRDFEAVNRASLSAHYTLRNRLKVALKGAQGDRSAAARSLGLSRQDLLKEMFRLGVR